MRLAAGTPLSPRTSTPRNPHRPGDRFIPPLASQHSFRMGVPAEDLAPEERLLRRHIPENSLSRPRSLSPDTLVLERARQMGRNPMNRRLSTGTIGVFGIGISQSGVVDPSALPQRQRGREVDGGILDNRRNLGREKDALALRISAALGVDRTRRVLNFNGESPISTEANNRGGLPGDPGHGSSSGKLWESVMGLGMYRRCVCSGRGWPWSADAVADEDGSPKPPSTSKTNRRSVPATPFRVLDAPGLRDDYYCSLIAYSPSSHTLAVGLHSDVYSWEEETGARSLAHWSNAHVTSLAFSSAQGNNDILAIGRINGSLSLWAPAEVRPRLNQRHSSGVACIAWKPKVTPRKRTDNRPVVLEAGVGYTEDLLVGDEAGNVYLYTVEWGRWDHDLRLDPPNAMMTLMRRIVVHSQQICGLAWSWDGSQFVTGGNDNVAFLYVTSEVMGARSQFGLMEPSPQIVLYGNEKHRWQHSAAVKAIAFCPWQKTLVATGTYRAPPPPHPAISLTASRWRKQRPVHPLLSHGLRCRPGHHQRRCPGDVPPLVAQPPRDRSDVGLRESRPRGAHRRLLVAAVPAGPPGAVAGGHARALRGRLPGGPQRVGRQ